MGCKKCFLLMLIFWETLFLMNYCFITRHFLVLTLGVDALGVGGILSTSKSVDCLTLDPFLIRFNK